MKPDKKNIDSAKPEDSSIFITCFTDGSFCHKTKAYGWAYWIKSESGINKNSGGGIGDVRTAQEVEQLAMTNLIDILIKNSEYIIDKVIVIQSDCLDLINKQARYYTSLLKEYGAKYVKFKHVKAHTNNQTNRTTVNKIVDKLAKDEMLKYRNHQTL